MATKEDKCDLCGKPMRDGYYKNIFGEIQFKKGCATDGCYNRNFTMQELEGTDGNA